MGQNDGSYVTTKWRVKYPLCLTGYICVVGGDGGGEPDAPVSLCIVVTSACDIEID